MSYAGICHADEALSVVLNVLLDFILEIAGLRQQHHYIFYKVKHGSMNY